MSTRFLTEKDKSELLNALSGYSKETDTKFNSLNSKFATKTELSQSKTTFDNQIKQINNKLASDYYNSKTIDDKFTQQSNSTDSKLAELSKKFYSKEDIDKMFGSYVDNLASLIGGIN